MRARGYNAAMTRLLAHYLVTAAHTDIRARAQALALEQSVEMPLAAITDVAIRTEIVATVEAITPAGHGRYRVVLGLAGATLGRDLGQLLNMLFGNCSLQPDVELIDAEWPDELLANHPGPRFGLAGLRAALGADQRALSMTALKPQGLAAAELAKLAGTFARAGLDIIKDDHGIANQDYAPFAARVVACQRAVSCANAARGGHSIYAPALSGGPRQLRQQIHVVREEGVGMVLACPMLLGLPVFDELVRHELPCPVIAHPALAGAGRIAPPLLLGRLFRLAGADATIFPNHGGRFSYDRATCIAIAQAARAPWAHLAASAPVAAGGMSVDRVEEMLATYGRDIILLIGGALLSAGPALAERAAEFVTRLHVAAERAA